MYVGIAAQCTSSTIQKLNGNCACGFWVEGFYTWQQGFDLCKSRGARLPEIYSAQENAFIYKIKVSIRARLSVV
jgi:hypothetical protein